MLLNRRIFYPRIWQAIVLLLIGLGLQLAAGLIFGFIMVLSHIPMNDMTVILLAISPLCTLGAALIALPIGRNKLWPYIKNKFDSKLNFLYCLLFFLGVYFVTNVIAGLLATLLPSNDSLNTVFEQAFNNWIGILALVVFAPIAEELLFRGIILRGFLKNYKPATAVIVTAVMFGVFHLNIPQGITATILGMALGFIFLKTGSLWVCMFFHALNNGLSTALYYLTLNSNITDGQFLMVMIPVFILGIVSAIILFKKQNNISNIITERNEGLRLQAEYESIQAQRQAELQAQWQAQWQAQISRNNPYNFQEGGDYMGQNYQGQNYPGQNYPGQNYPGQNYQGQNMYGGNYMMGPLKHSGLGIASFVLSIIVILMYVIGYIIIKTSITVSVQAAVSASLTFGFMTIFGVVLNLTGIGLGIGGAVQKNYKKVFPILGLVLNILLILLFVILLIIGSNSLTNSYMY